MFIHLYFLGIVALNMFLIFILSYLFYGPIYDALSSRLQISDTFYMFIVSLIIAFIITLVDALVVIIWILNALLGI